MEKKEVEKKTGIKRFSVCVMNPPYASGLGNRFYNISDKIRKHIEEILPDYYNIRK